MVVQQCGADWGRLTAYAWVGFWGAPPELKEISDNVLLGAKTSKYGGMTNHPPK